MPNPSPSATLPCEQCGFMNEAERVYCHSCGAKLDRSLLPKADEKKQEDPQETRKRIAKMTNPTSNWVGRELKALCSVVIYSALLAAVILVVRAPDDVPDKKAPQTMRLVSSDLMEAMESPTPRAISFNEGEINQYFKQMKSKEGSIPGVEFVRAFVRLRPGVLRLSSEQSVAGYPIYSGVDYKLEYKEGKLKATIVGGNFGRLAVDPQLMNYAEVAFAKLFTALQRERKQMDRFSSVVVQEGRIDLVTKPGAR